MVTETMAIDSIRHIKSAVLLFKDINGACNTQTDTYVQAFGIFIGFGDGMVEVDVESTPPLCFI